MAGGIGRVYVPCRFDYAAGRKQRREAKNAYAPEGAPLESEQTKPQSEPSRAPPPKRTPRNVVAVGMFA